MQPPISESEIRGLVSKYGEPLFIVDEATLLDRFHRIRMAYSSFSGNVDVAYTIKTNFLPMIIRVLSEEGAMFDLTTPEELYFLLNVGADPKKVIYTSITEQKGEFSSVLRGGVQFFGIGSYFGLQHLRASVAELDTQAQILIRVNPQVSVKAMIKASAKVSKFGVVFHSNTPDNAFSLIREALGDPKLSFNGLHFHLGSQVEDTNAYIKALDRIEMFIVHCRKNIENFPAIQTIDVGGGIPVDYGTPVSSPEEIGAAVSERLNRLSDSIGSKFNLIVESGRYISSEPCDLVARIIDINKKGRKRIIFVDVGYNYLIDAQLLKQAFPIYAIPPSISSSDYDATEVFGLVGDESHEIPLSLASRMGVVKKGGLLVFRKAGAYTITHQQPRSATLKPAIVFRHKDGNIVLARKRQTLDDLYEAEGGNLAVSE